MPSVGNVLSQVAQMAASALRIYVFEASSSRRLSAKSPEFSIRFDLLQQKKQQKKVEEQRERSRFGCSLLAIVGLSAHLLFRTHFALPSAASSASTANTNSDAADGDRRTESLTAFLSTVLPFTFSQSVIYM